MGELQSSVKCIWGLSSLVKSGDIIKVSFQKFLYSYDKSVRVVGEPKVMMCGAHLIQELPWSSNLKLAENLSIHRQMPVESSSTN